MAAMGQAVLVFCGQNVGAGNIKRLKNIYWESLAVTFGVGVVISGVCMLFDRSFLGLFTNDAAVVQIGLQRLSVIVPFYFICGFYECASGACRGTGYALFPMIGALFGVCLFRVIWLYTAFSWSPTFETLVSVYPVSWAITFVILSVMFAIFYHLLKKRQSQN
jgi:Na+-driven multidrug efflux pump